jgi:hypothetical protein
MGHIRNNNKNGSNSSESSECSDDNKNDYNRNNNSYFLKLYTFEFRPENYTIR